MKRRTKEQKLSTLATIGKHIEKYRLMMIIVLSLFLATIVALIIYWNFDENNISEAIDNSYLIFQVIVGALTIPIIVVLFLNKHQIVNRTLLAIIFHVYAFLLMFWGTSMCILDLKIGLTPIFYFIIATAVSSLFVLEPLFFTIMSGSAFTAIIICHIVNHYDFFSGVYAVENILYFVIFALLFVLNATRHFTMTMKEDKALAKVEHMTYYDELTGLLNERSYISKTEEINNHIENNKIKPFAVVLMDVNNLKATNDAYGHRYGCHLVVRTGHTLPEIFKTSSLYHVGGDEFLAIVEGEDYEHFEERIEEFDKVCRYSRIEYEGKELIFSIARGYAKYEEGNLYKDVLQKADSMMYENKAEIKSTYKLKGR